MAQRIHLNGGPWHDRYTDAPPGNHFHIREATDDTPPTFEELATGILTTTPYREGTYSQVRHVPGEYEWDGWVTHE